jgi:UDP-glucuronate 4-epimerase
MVYIINRAILACLITIIRVEACSQVDKERVLLTGGAGFIGSHVAEALLKKGYTVIIVDNLHPYYDPRLKKANIAHIIDTYKEQLKFYQVNICDKKTLSDIFAHERPSYICHLAACAGVRASIEDPAFYIDTNIQGTLTILELAKQYLVKNCVIASSSSVYGQSKEVPFTESNTATMPCSPYAVSKRASELLSYTYHYLYDIPCTCLRFFTVYGPRGRPDMAPFLFLDAIYQKKPIKQFGNGMAIRDFTYIDDIVNGILQALEKPLGFEIINLGRGEPILLKDFISTIETVTGKKAIIEQTDSFAGDVSITHADITKAQVLLGYQPKVSVREGIQKMFDWYMTEYLPVRPLLRHHFVFIRYKRLFFLYNT